MIVRSDLPRGVLAAQLVHAAGESSPGDLEEGTHAYVLSVPDEMSLKEVSARLSRACVPHILITEPNAPYHGQAMAIGLQPTQRKEDLRKHLSSLPLLR